MQNKKSTVIFLIIAFVLVFGITLVSNFYYTPPTVTIIPDKGVKETPPKVKVYKMSEVVTHSDSSSCWTVVNNNVYDLTAWINQHPGGPEAILSICGKDGTTAFTAQHGGQRRPEDELKTLFIGTLSK